MNHTGRGLIQPKRIALPDFLPYAIARNASGEELPVTLRVQVSAIHWQAVVLANGVVPVTLHFVDAVRYEARRVAFMRMVLLERLLIVQSSGWRGRCG